MCGPMSISDILMGLFLLVRIDERAWRGVFWGGVPKSGFIRRFYGVVSGVLCRFWEFVLESSSQE